jgi:hypothetical protein
MINKQAIEQSAITAIVTFIVSVVGLSIFNINCAVYSGIAAGLSVTVGKEYGDSLIMENNWHWHDVIPGIVGVFIGILMCVILHMTE